MPDLRSVFLFLVGLTVSACGPTGLPADSAQFEDAASASDTPAAEFVGSSECQTCHQAEFEDWLGSHHQQAMQEADDETVLGDFGDASVDYFGTMTRFYTRDGGYFVETPDQAGELREFRVAYTFGVEPLQQYLIEFPGGRLQTLAYSWDTRTAAEGGQRWFHQYPDEYIAPDDSLHWTGPQQNWNYMCAECHSTNVDMAYDAASATFATTYSEISVGCESCHGPGSTHVQLANSEAMPAHYGLAVNLDDRGDAAWVMNMETGIAERSELRLRPPVQPEACGRCHSRRGIIAPEYEYGEPLTHSHMPALLEDSLYFADGQILDEVYVYGSFLQSRMYQAGVTCTDCHNPHSAELITGSDVNDVCSQCHLPATFAVEEHAGHLAEDAGCVDCHMTSRTYMVVDDRRDHSFRIPRPDLSQTANTPNACAGCHVEQDDAWAVTAIESWRDEGEQPRDHFADALYAGRRGFANDQLRGIISDRAHPGIARATAVSLLRPPFGSADVRALETELGSDDPLLRIAALRQLRDLPAELRLRLPGAALLSDDVRGVRIEAVSAYAGTGDLLPVEAARAYTSAREEFRAANLAIANRPEALLALASLERAEGNLAAAVEHFEQALKLEPRAVAARVNLADAERVGGNEARAETLLREGLDLDDNAAPLHHALGLSLVRSGQSDEALASLRMAASLASENSRYAYVLGVALNSLGEQEEALRQLAAAYETFPDNFDISMALATIRRDSGDTAGALDVAYELARRHPEDPNVLAVLRSLGAVP